MIVSAWQSDCIVIQKKKCSNGMFVSFLTCNHGLIKVFIHTNYCNKLRCIEGTAMKVNFYKDEENIRIDTLVIIDTLSKKILDNYESLILLQSCFALINSFLLEEENNEIFFKTQNLARNLDINDSCKKKFVEYTFWEYFFLKKLGILPSFNYCMLSHKRVPVTGVLLSSNVFYSQEFADIRNLQDEERCSFPSFVREELYCDSIKYSDIYKALLISNYLIRNYAAKEISKRNLIQKEIKSYMLNENRT